MNLPSKVPPDGFGLVEAVNPEYWRTLNEMGKRGELPEKTWPKKVQR